MPPRPSPQPQAGDTGGCGRPAAGRRHLRKRVSRTWATTPTPRSCASTRTVSTPNHPVVAEPRPREEGLIIVHANERLAEPWQLDDGDRPEHGVDGAAGQ